MIYTLEILRVLTHKIEEEFKSYDFIYENGMCNEQGYEFAEEWRGNLEELLSISNRIAERLKSVESAYVGLRAALQTIKEGKELEAMHIAARALACTPRLDEIT